MQQIDYDIPFYLNRWRIDIWLQFFLLCLVLLIALVFFIKIRRYLRLYEENSTFKVINELYSLFHNLTNTKGDWQLTHLLCITETEYKEAWEKINDSIKDYTPAQLYELQSKEKSMVINIMVFYEQVFYQFSHSRSFKKRRKFLFNLNDYFLSRLFFQNPRLAYFILSTPEGMRLHLEEESYEEILIRFEELLMPGSVKLSFDRCGPLQKEYPYPDESISNAEDLDKPIDKK